MLNVDPFLGEKLALITQRAQAEEFERQRLLADPTVRQRKADIAEFDAAFEKKLVSFERIGNYLIQKARHIFSQTAKSGLYNVRFYTACNDFSFDTKDVIFESDFDVLIPPHIHMYLFSDFKTWCAEHCLTLTQQTEHSFTISWEKK